MRKRYIGKGGEGEVSEPKGKKKRGNIWRMKCKRKVKRREER